MSTLAMTSAGWLSRVKCRLAMRQQDSEQGLKGQSVTATNPRLRGRKAERGLLGHMPCNENYSSHNHGKWCGPVV